MSDIIITMKMKKSTKGTHVYEEVEQDTAMRSIPTVYIKRSRLPSPPPATITLKVEFE